MNDFFGFADNVEVVNDFIQSVDTEQKTATGASGSKYEYDKLVLAFGNKTDFYNIPGLDKYSYGVKNINEALRFKRHLHEQLMNNDIEQSYVVVGAGATGVELSAEMMSYLKHVRKSHNVTSNFTVYLVEAAPRVLNKLPERYAHRLQERLKRVGVQLVLDTAVDAETKDYIELKGEKIASHTVVWTAGVKNDDLANNVTGVERGKLNRIKVNDMLEAGRDVYVIGDSADTQYSGMAQTALHHADYVAEAITLELAGEQRKPYRPERPIYAVPVGTRWSAVLWGRMEVYGFFGWVLRRMADLRLYIKFLPAIKALTAWRYGFEKQEVCPVCNQK